MIRRNWKSESAYLRRMATKCRKLAEQSKGPISRQLLRMAMNMEQRAEKIGEHASYLTNNP